ncbi:hypothetical protein [Kordiimonas sp. SCSIO 12610]|uniref:hypothetical protein n=1 Tax=Kordiimonas sp. SCSIO 12610 TaxID=2829597 RepID=UPI00210EC03D|nr:hypothetical protein [Kordiimonas sp. SCSIO 12610]UTW56226.1 hypothetical protein KFF44_04820 [Kordiimonas sp. SCSIO 12610]
MKVYYSKSMAWFIIVIFTCLLVAAIYWLTLIYDNVYNNADHELGRATVLTPIILIIAPYYIGSKIRHLFFAPDALEVSSFGLTINGAWSYTHYQWASQIKEIEFAYQDDGGYLTSSKNRYLKVIGNQHIELDKLMLSHLEVDTEKLSVELEKYTSINVNDDNKPREIQLDYNAPRPSKKIRKYTTLAEVNKLREKPLSKPQYGRRK